MNLQSLEMQCRYMRFTWDGKESNLHGARGLDAMPEQLLKALINECGVEINADGRFDREILHGTLDSGVNNFTLPTNLLAVEKIMIFDGITSDHEDSNSAEEGSDESDVAIIGEVNIGEFSIGETITTSSTSATIADHQSSSGDVYQLEGPVLSHAYLIQGNTTAEGMPSKFMLYEQAGTLFAQLDKETDAEYEYDLYYLPAPTTMANDSSVPDIGIHYHNLYRALAAKKVAEFLGDDRSVMRHATSYEALVKKLKGLRYGRPARVKFSLIPGVPV